MAIFVFPAIIHKENETYGLVFPDLPGCVTVGDSQTELAISASEALSGHLELMMEDGDHIPEPTPIEQIELDASTGDIAKTLVTAYANAPKSKQSAA